MAYLSWIADEKIEACVREVLSKGFEGIKKTDKNLFRNGIDPFSALFDAACHNISLETWMTFERRRQSQKTLQNALGNFHQQVLSKVEGWKIPEENFIDLVCEDRKIVVEVKNKHNTVKKSDLKVIYDELQEAVMHKTSRYRNYTGYYATVIPSSHARFNRMFTPSDNATQTSKPGNELIREIDGFSFYALVTGQETALQALYQVLPVVIKSVLTEDYFQKFPQNQLDSLLASPLRNQLFGEAFG
jgi:hypothetical protein